MDETVNTAEVNEYTIVGDVLDSSFENLTFFEFADDLALLFLKFCLEESLVRYDNIAEFLVDLDDLEVHCLVNKCIVILDRTDVDLRTREEGLDSENVHDHTALRTGLDITFYDFALVECLVYHIPRTQLTSFLVRKDELSLLVFRRLYVNLNFVTYFEVRIVTELWSSDDTVALVADVNDNLSLVDRGYSSLNYFIFINF